MIEYPDNSDPHPPPEESISSEKIFDSYYELEMISEAEVLAVTIPISHSSEELKIDNRKMEDNSSLSISNHYEQWLGFHHDSPMQRFIKTLQGFPDFNVWLNKINMFLGWFDPKKRSKLIKLEKGSSTSHPGQGFFRHLRSYFIHDMAVTYVLYFIQLDSEKVKSTSEQTTFQVFL